MVKRNPKNIRSHNLIRENLSASTKPADSYADELIKSLSEKRENRRAKQTWEWEQVRRNSAFLRDAA
ncbi:MAG: hypothetical protein AAB336_00840 [Acidobacteriota bacterium]